MTLVLEIEYLLGTCFAAIGPDAPSPDWPPQPDRVFSALVSTWAVRGENEQEKRALEWLEAQRNPVIAASDHNARTEAECYVPANDPQTGRSGNREVIPTFRPRQSRRFPATRPISPVVRIYWPDAEPNSEILGSLKVLAADTSYIGHSSSLTRCDFESADKPPNSIQSPIREIYPGRLAELERSYAVFVKTAGKAGRPLAGSPTTVPTPARREFPHAFSDRWLLLEHVSDLTIMPDIRAATILSKAIRHALISGYKRIGLETKVPEILSGHAHDGTPSRVPHAAITPLPFVGFRYADGHVMGFALVPPPNSGILDDDAFRNALRSIAPLDENHGRRLITIQSKAGSIPESAFRVQLSPTLEPPLGKRSLDPQLYTTPDSTFATVTPIVLDRHLKEKGSNRIPELIEQISTACTNIGLPEPESIIPHKHAAFEGSPSAYPSGNSPSWLNWRLPGFLANRQLTHAIIRFHEPVQGPILLGAGRFVGMGLCRPLSTPTDIA